MKLRKIEKIHLLRLGIFAVVLAAVLAVLPTLRARYISQTTYNESAELENVGVTVTDLDTLQSVDWQVELPATTCLYETSAKNEEFNRAVVVKRLMITNDGQADLKVEATYEMNAATGTHGEQDQQNFSEDNVCIYIVGKDLGAPDKSEIDYRAMIQNEISNINPNLANADDIETLRTALKEMNENTLEAWSGELQPKQAKLINIIIWRENTTTIQTAKVGTRMSIQNHLKLSVSQVNESN
jgi:Fe-S cluster assembly iron-binding protein IscA